MYSSHEKIDLAYGYLNNKNHQGFCLEGLVSRIKVSNL